MADTVRGTGSQLVEKRQARSPADVVARLR
jgi:hypothetical protein